MTYLKRKFEHWKVSHPSTKPYIANHSRTQFIYRLIATCYNTCGICKIMSLNYKWQSGNTVKVLGRIFEHKREGK